MPFYMEYRGPRLDRVCGSAMNYVMITSLANCLKYGILYGYFSWPARWSTTLFWDSVPWLEVSLIAISHDNFKISHFRSSFIGRKNCAISRTAREDDY